MVRIRSYIGPAARPLHAGGNSKASKHVAPWSSVAGPRIRDSGADIHERISLWSYDA